MNDVKYSICSSLDFEYRLWVIIFTQERAPRQTFTYLKSTIETLKKSVKIIQSNNRDTRTTFYSFICYKFGHNLLLFLVSCCWVWTSKCFLGPTLSIYKRWNNTAALTYRCAKTLGNRLTIPQWIHYFGIPEFLDSGCKSWTLDSGQWTLDAGLWTQESVRWTLDAGRWTLNPGRSTLDSRRWTPNAKR